MKNTLILGALIGASALNAQSFVAGWDFDDVGTTETSMTANWGDLSGSASLTWTHDVALGPPTFAAAEFGIGRSFNSAVVGNTFAFVDPNTGFDQFSRPGGAAEGGFNSLSASDSFTFSFDGSGYSSLSLSYAFDAEGDDNWAIQTVDLSSFVGNSSAAFNLNTVSGANYDNFALTGTAVPEPSAYAAIFGMIAIAFAATRRNRK